LAGSLVVIEVGVPVFLSEVADITVVLFEDIDLDAPDILISISANPTD
jgi:hypothetical protein